MRPRILVVAYACEPGTGSESGAGWVWSRMLAQIADVWVVTRANNRGAIEEALPLAPERDHLRFVYVDLPEKLRFWKKGNRGARLYYMVWQGMVLREARRIDAEMSFDAVWHLTMSTVWLGSLAPLLRKRFILGPVGGGVGTPWRLAPSLGVKGAIYDAARGAARVLARYANPLARLAWRRAELILAQNPETRDWLPTGVRRRVEVFPHIVLDDSSAPMDPPITASHPRRDGHVAIYAGRLLPWKGVSLAIRALPLLPDWQLLLCGTGPDAGRLRDIASDAGVDDRVTFLGWVPRPDLLRLMHERGDVFVFPSLHDEGGWVIAEALACGLPVVCLDRGGPRVLAGGGVPISTVSNTIAALASAVEQAALDGPGKAPPIFDDASGRLAQLLASRLGLGSMPDENDLRDEIAHG